MKRINLKESLLQIDKQTDFKYTLTDLYEACMLGDDDKKKLVQYVEDKDIPAMSAMLSNAAGVMSENVSDDLPDDEVTLVENDNMSLQRASNLEDIEYIMSYELPDCIVYDGDNAGEYKCAYHNGVSVDVKFNLDAYGYVYTIDGEGPYETRSSETVQSDITRALDRKGVTEGWPEDQIKESLEKGDELTLWWKDPSWDKHAPCYARVEFAGKDTDGKYRFRSTTYGHMFFVDLTTNEITTPQGKVHKLDNSSGWMKVFNGSMNETFKSGDMVFVKPSKKLGRVVSVNGDNVEVEVHGGNDPDRKDTYYKNDLELQDSVDEDWNPYMTDCPSCGDTSFDSKKGICNKCSYKESWFDDEDEESEYEFVSRKYVTDSDGFQTEYTWYKSPDGLNVFVFGDSDFYRPEDGNFDYEEENDEVAQQWFDSYNGFDDDLDEKVITESDEDEGVVFYNFLDARGRSVEDMDEVEVSDDAQAIMAGKSNPQVITVTKFINGSRKPDEVLWERESDKWYVSRYIGGAEYEPAEGGYYYETLTLDDSLQFATKEEAMEALKEIVAEYDEGELVYQDDVEARFKLGKYIGDCEELYVEREPGIHASGKQVYEALEDHEYARVDGRKLDEAIKYPNGQPVTDIDLNKALDYQYGTDRDKNNSTYSDEEKQRAVNYWMDKTDPRPDGKSYMEEAVAPDYSPKQTGKAYKVFRVKNGKLYPPMVANPGGADTPVGVWLTAEEGEFAGVSKTGRPQVKSIGSGTLSYRPGWHLGDIPRASQFDRTNKETGEKEFPKDFVWAECDYVMDVDYQPESDEQGYMRMGKDGKPYRSDKYQHSLAGLPKLPKDGYYKYRTNPRPDTVPWVITGAIRVNKLLSDAEVNSILQSKGIEPIHRQGGDKTLAELGL